MRISLLNRGRRVHGSLDQVGDRSESGGDIPPLKFLDIYLFKLSRPDLWVRARETQIRRRTLPSYKTERGTGGINHASSLNR